MNWHTNLIVNDQRYTFIDLAKVAADFNAELKDYLTRFACY